MVHINTLPAERLEDIVKMFDLVAEATRQEAFFLRSALKEGKMGLVKEIAERALDQLMADLRAIHRMLFDKYPKIREFNEVVTGDNWEEVILLLEDIGEEIGDKANEMRFSLANGWLYLAAQDAVIGFCRLKSGVWELHILLSGELTPDIYYMEV